MATIAKDDTVQYGPFRACLVIKRYDDEFVEIMTEKHTRLRVLISECRKVRN